MYKQSFLCSGVNNFIFYNPGLKSTTMLLNQNSSVWVQPSSIKLLMKNLVFLKKQFLMIILLIQGLGQ